MSPLSTTSLSLLLATAMLGAAAPAAQAAEFELFYHGSFNTSEALTLASAGAPSFFSAVTPFTITARFDDSSPNQVPPVFPFTGFKAFIPSTATLSVGGQSFSIETAASNAAAGITVALFDRSNIFTPNLYGVGFIADVMNDGAGIVGDWSSASPEFTVDQLTPTTLTSYNGVGHGSGICLSGQPPACPHAVTPWVLHDAAGQAWALTLGNYSEVQVAAGGLVNTATLAAVPEPASAALLLCGVLGVAGLSRRQQRAQRAARSAV